MCKKYGRKAFMRAVRAEVEHRELERRSLRPIGFSNLTIDFVARTVQIRGRTVTTEMPLMVIPLLDTEQAVLPRD